MTSPVSSRAHADLALAVYLEPHAEGRRVLLLGEAQGDLADRLDRIAAHLEIIDPGAREPSRGEVPELPFDDRAFDLILVCDVAALPEPTEGAVRELHRVLARDGLLALASDAPANNTRRRRGGPPQAALERLLSEEFRQVRMLAQSALAGYAVGELEGRGGDEFSVDSSLVKGARREPERLLGIGSDARLSLEPRLWVEVPVARGGDGQERAPAGLVDELRRAEDEAREALHRESDLLRKLEGERNARLDAEHLLERARGYEQKLLAAEADYDDAVARVRYFENAVTEHEANAKHERKLREQGERELSRLKNDAGSAGERVKRAEHERDAARADLDEAHGELSSLEERLVELGKQVRGLEHDKKHHETTARDLLEELRRLEHDKTAAVEHDARVAELEAERDRAVQRALEAEVAREAAQMRVDELRAELEAPRAPPPPPAPVRAAAPAPQEHEVAGLRKSAAASKATLGRLQVELAQLRGEGHGLRLRLSEAERALEATTSPGEQLGRATRELSELRLRLSETEAALHAMREAPREAAAPSRGTGRERALEAQLSEAEERLAELTRELEEADRFAELHAEDSDRFAATEGELAQSRARLDELDDEVRALDADLRAARDELATARGELQRAQASADAANAESAAQAQQLTRLERERDAATAALADARGILAQLAGRVGGDENDPPTIVQALLAQGDARDERERTIDALRAQIADRDARIAQLERVNGESREAPEF